MEKSFTNKNDYWIANLKLVAGLLLIWFFVSFGCGILFADYLDQFTFFGFKLGFWFAQQGSIYIFVILIFIYINRMKKLDQKFKNSSDEGK
jgi:putative solute:sodium symporter small subunit